MTKKNMWFAIPLIGMGFLALIAAGGFAVQQLWNWLLPSIADVRELTFWQALGLLALCRILFGGFGRGGSHRGPGGRHRDRRDWWKKQGCVADAERPASAGSEGQ